jgi:hypothetical protein
LPWEASHNPIAIQHGVAVDRFAREIARFLSEACAARSRQLNANPLAGKPSFHYLT